MTPSTEEKIKEAFEKSQIRKSLKVVDETGVMTLGAYSVFEAGYLALLNSLQFTTPELYRLPEGYQLVPTEPTEAMVLAGQEIAHELIMANCCKSMNGLGGGKTWQEFKNTCKNLELCEMYLNNDIDSVEAIYRAMLAAAKEMK